MGGEEDGSSSSACPRDDEVPDADQEAENPDLAA